MFTPLRTFLDPLAKEIDLKFRERRAVLGLGHDIIRIRGFDALDHFGCIRISGNDDGISGFALSESELAVNKRNLPRLFDPTVAGGAVRIQNRADIACKIDLSKQWQSERGSDKGNTQHDGSIECNLA